MIRRFLAALGTDATQLRARLSGLSGRLPRQIDRLPAGLYVFNFHRIGDRGATAYDPNVFSCGQENLERHLRAIQDHFDIIAPEELEAAEARRTRDRCALITFDDGYRDNYTAALPVLLSNRVQAIFFICTGFIESGHLPWWDRVAAMVRLGTAEAVTLNGATIPIHGRPIDEAIRDVLREFKLIEEKSADKMALLEAQLRPDSPPSEDRLFMNWDEVRETRERGMTIGSHTLSHEKLAHIPAPEEYRELEESKALLDERLQQDTRHLAYPVGGYDSFTERTMSVSQSLGYRFAFTTEQHGNSWHKLELMALGRFQVSCENPELAQHLMLKHIHG